jgi:hypothetical protein
MTETVKVENKNGPPAAFHELAARFHLAFAEKRKPKFRPG